MTVAERVRGTWGPRRELVWLLVICLVAVVTRLICFFIVRSHDPSCMMTPDSSTYEGPALAVLETGHFAVSPERPDIPMTVRTPGYPAFIATVYAIAGRSRSALIVVQMLVSAGTIVVTYMIGRTLWTAGVGLIAAVVLLLDVTSFLYVQEVGTETLFTFLLTLGLLAGVRVITGSARRRGWALLLGVCLALATLVRPIGYYLVIPVVVGCVVVERLGRRPWRRALATAGIVLVPSVVLVGGWQVRNYAATGSGEFTHIKGINMLFCFGADIVAHRDGISYDEAKARIDETVPGHEAWNMWSGTYAYPPEDPPTAELAAVYQGEGLRIIRSHPRIFVQSELRGIARLLFEPGERMVSAHVGTMATDEGPGGDVVRLSPGAYVRKWLGRYPARFLLFVFAVLYLLVVYVGSAYAVGSALRADRGRLAVHLFLWGTIAYMLVLSGGSMGYSRFRAPLMPLFALYAGYGLHGFWTAIRARCRRARQAA